MSSKRKLASLGLDRRVRARREDEWEPESASGEEPPSGSDDDVSAERIGSGDDDGDEDSTWSEAESDAGSESDEADSHDAPPPKADLSSVSFGALARAQASLPLSARRPTTRPPPARATDADAPGGRARSSNKAPDRRQAKRASKHAPQEQSSKKPVPRRREILADPRRKHRDPRFDPLVGRLDESRAASAYAFLDGYRDSEMADLRARIAKTKDPAAREPLKRLLMSLESRKKARQSKLEEQRLLQDHRCREKELVAQGKRPFYLKKSEQKKQLLTKRYEGMSKGQVDRAIQRKRKKVAGQEKKELDSLQRVRNRH